MTEISTERKLAFQDGIRTSISKLDRYAMEQVIAGDAAGYHAASEMIAKLREDIEFGEPAPEVDYQSRLKVTEEIFRAVVDHASDGGSYRGLIYGRLGFQTDAYSPLYLAGGMTISNEFVMMDADAGVHEDLLQRLDTYLKNLPVGPDRSMLVDVASTIRGSLAALAGEQEKRERMQAEIDDLVRHGVEAVTTKESSQSGSVSFIAGSPVGAAGGNGGAGGAGIAMGAGGAGRPNPAVLPGSGGDGRPSVPQVTIPIGGRSNPAD